MRHVSNLIAVALVATAAAAFAEGEASDPTVRARQDLMKTIGMNVKILGNMAGGKAAFDAEAAGRAQAALAAAAAEIPAKFKPQASDPASDAKPGIWTGWDDFVTKAGALKAAAEALDPASLEKVQAGIAGVGGACKACHSVYRM
ncbi:MAG: cytochrome c [Gemmobacter sp.]|jgi:cytochrome c556|nr:cytochrome c [Gemmobacter sp.]